MSKNEISKEKFESVKNAIHNLANTLIEKGGENDVFVANTTLELLEDVTHDNIDSTRFNILLLDVASLETRVKLLSENS